MKWESVCTCVRLCLCGRACVYVKKERKKKKEGDSIMWSADICCRPSQGWNVILSFTQRALALAAIARRPLFAFLHKGNPIMKWLHQCPIPFFPLKQYFWLKSQNLPFIPWCSRESCSTLSLRSSSLSNARLGVNCCSIASCVRLNGFNMSPALLWLSCLCCSRINLTAEGRHWWGFTNNRAGGTTWNTVDEVLQPCAGGKGNWEQEGVLFQAAYLLWCYKLRSSKTLHSTETIRQYIKQSLGGKNSETFT